MNAIKRLLLIILSLLIVFSINGYIEKIRVDNEFSDFKKRGEFVMTIDDTNYYKVTKKYNWEDPEQTYNIDDPMQIIGKKGDMILTNRNPLKEVDIPIVPSIVQVIARDFFCGHGTINSTDDGLNIIEVMGDVTSDREETGVKVNFNDWILADDGSPYIVGMRVKNVTKEQIDTAISYAEKQIGKPYNYSFLFFRYKSFYCTDLLSRAYREANIGINYDYLATTGNDIILSKNTYIFFLREKIEVDGQTKYNIYFLSEE